MISQFLSILFVIFIVVDPIGLVPLYIGLTTCIEAAKKKLIIRKAVLISFAVLAVFVVAGRGILALLHIETGAFFIAGGIMLFLVSLEMLFGRPTSKLSEREQENDAENEETLSIAVFPLAIPMLAGPGTITAIILFTGSAENITDLSAVASTAPSILDLLPVMLMLILAIIVTLAAVYVILRSSDFILKLLGRTGVSVVERIMGLLLSGLSVQFAYDGIVRLGILGT